MQLLVNSCPNTKQPHLNSVPFSIAFDFKMSIMPRFPTYSSTLPCRQQSKLSTFPRRADEWCISAAPVTHNSAIYSAAKPAPVIGCEPQGRKVTWRREPIKQAWWSWRQQYLTLPSHLDVFGTCYYNETGGCGAGVRADCRSGWKLCGSSSVGIWLCTEDTSSRWESQ